jgi:hypothetical protein
LSACKAMATRPLPCSGLKYLRVKSRKRRQQQLRR